MDKLLKKAIENEMLRKPSQGFSDKVMSRIFELKVKNEFQPLISTKIWICTAFTFAAILIASFFVHPQAEEVSKFGLAEKIESFFSSIKLPSIDFVTNINLLIVSGICLALFFLLFLDMVLFKKK